MPTASPTQPSANHSYSSRANNGSKSKTSSFDVIRPGGPPSPGIPRLSGNCLNRETVPPAIGLFLVRMNAVIPACVWSACHTFDRLREVVPLVLQLLSITDNDKGFMTCLNLPQTGAMYGHGNAHEMTSQKVGLGYSARDGSAESDKVGNHFDPDPVHDLRVALSPCRSMVTLPSICA